MGAPRGSSLLLDAYRGVDRWAFGPDGCEEVDLPGNVPHERLMAAPLAGLAELDLDVAFALGGFDDTQLDGIARLGIWRIRVDGSGEVAAGEPPRLAYQSWARTYPLSVARNRRALLSKTAELPARALREAQRSGRAWLEQCRLASGLADSGGPSPISTLSKIGSRIVRRSLEKALGVEQWSLAFRFGAGRAVPPDLAGFTRITPPADRDWADPFALEKNGRHYVFFEERVHGSAKGRIAMLELGPDGRRSEPVRVLERDYHLSHPFVLEHDGELYLIPESARNLSVEAYRCVDFPRVWRLEHVLLDGVRLVDATFHRAPERWWMFANGAAGASRVFDDDLHLYHAPMLFGAWQPHRRNPVKSDARCTRPAGALYWHNGALYRPAQVCAPRYGAGLCVNRVLRLTPTEYAERQVESLAPAAGLLGIHTVNRAGALTVVDFLARCRRI